MKRLHNVINVKKILAVINATYAVAGFLYAGFMQAFFSQLHKLR